MKKNRGRIFGAGVVLIVALAMLMSACGKKNVQTEDIGFSGSRVMEAAISEEDQKVIDGIISYFMPLTEIPRQSHHEEMISEYLYNWAEERGFSPRQDDQNNVIFDVPATSGKEKVSMTILQAHMDMVIAVDEGKTFDPLTDGITVINDGKTLTADGTSLGADDGMGIATILYFIDNNKSHGPLRIIFTTNEEDGMTGVFALKSSDVEGAKYVINLDSETSDEVTNSSAAGVTVRYNAEYGLAAPTFNTGIQIKISDLLSGHSGVDIDKGRMNAIKAMGTILGNLKDENIDFQLSKLSGGSAMNAIAGFAELLIAVDGANKEAALKNINSSISDLKAEYGAVETKMVIEAQECGAPARVLNEAGKESVVSFVSEIFNGIWSMSSEVEGLVESSSNIGLISLDANVSGAFSATTYIRSSDHENLYYLIAEQLYLAYINGIESSPAIIADPWPVKSDSNLLKLVENAYKKQTGSNIKVVQLHAGLETGTFAKLDENLDIVSIGLDVKNPHTINEVCYLETIPIFYSYFEMVMKNIK